MGWCWKGCAVAICAATALSACGGGARDTAAVSARTSVDDVVSWRAQWADSAEQFWVLVGDWRKDMSAGTDAAHVEQTASAAAVIAAAADRWAARLSPDAVPGDVAARAAALRAALAAYGTTWSRIASCGAVAQCQDALADTAESQLPDVRSAEFALRPR